LKNIILIPRIADREGWKKYFEIDIVRALGYSQRILDLYNRITTDSSNILIKKMVMGVIGRDTIGHWRDIQQIYAKLLGIKCVKCEEAVKRISAGIPFEKVVDSVSISFVPGWKLLDDIKTISIILSSVLNKVEIFDKIDQQRDLVNIDILVKQLSSNPLEITKLIKGFYSILISLLPLYNEYTFFLHITKAFPNSLMKKFFPGLNLDELSKFGVKYDFVNICREEEPLLVHSNNSVARYINMYVETIYLFIKRSLKIGFSKSFKIVDEEHRYLSTMIREAARIGEDIGKDIRKKVLNIIRTNSIIQKLGQKYVCSNTNIVFHRNRCQVAIGSTNISYTEFIEGLTPYLLTGLAIFKDIQEKDREVVKARMHIYYSLKDLELKIP
jgi:hypothetical protein